MKVEIKEILDRAKKLKYKCNCCEQIGEGVYISKYHEIETQNLIEAVYIIDKLLDYITNLQQENEKLKELVKPKTQIFIDTEDMEERYGQELYEDYLKEQLEYYKSRCEKAIEYIKSYNLPEDLGSLNECPISVGELKQLLSILQGENKK